jgi:hypothetical protein
MEQNPQEGAETERLGVRKCGAVPETECEVSSRGKLGVSDSEGSVRRR